MTEVVLRGDTVYLPRQVAVQAAGGSVAAQTREILARVDRLLAEAGTGKSRLRSVHIRLTDMASFNEMNEVWDVWTIDGQTHRRAIAEAELDSRGHAIEIAITAAR